MGAINQHTFHFETTLKEGPLPIEYAENPKRNALVKSRFYLWAMITAELWFSLIMCIYIYIHNYVIYIYIFTNTCLCFWASMSVKGRKGIQEGNVASWPLISPSHSLVNGAWLAREYLVASNFLCTCSWSFSNICDWLNTPKIGQNHQKLWS